MNGAVGYGVLLAITMLLVDALWPSSGAWFIFWLAVAVQSIVAAIITWRRTGLPLATAWMALGAMASAVFAVAAARGVLPEELLRAYWLEAIAVIALLLFLFVEVHRRHPAHWARWREHQKHCSFRDYLMFRHIPNFRIAR